MDPVDAIVDLFERCGRESNAGYAVCLLEHALQAAHLARNEGATDCEIAAALLHDIGHMLPGEPHEIEGQRWLAPHFPPEVVDCVRLHVAAKRYLCAKNPYYPGRLSEASVRSLERQGGLMTAEEAAAFEAEPHFRSAVRVRLWDDAAKVAGWEVAGVEEYRGMLKRVAIGGTGKS